jgi:hypothetical protein
MIKADRKPIFMLIFLLTTLTFASPKTMYGFFMEKHTYFVDQHAPDHEVQEVKGQPSGYRFTGKSHEGDFYHINIYYPVDHRVEMPLKQWAMLRIGGRGEIPTFKFVIKKWVLRDDKKNVYDQIVRHDFGYREKGLQKIGNILNTEYGFRELTETFNFYYDIPKHVKYLTLEFEVEITSPQGEKITVKDSIPLKRAVFKTSFFEGFFH